MTERAIFIEDNGSNPQSGPYSMGVMDNFVRAIMGWPSADTGVVPSAENELAASVIGGSVRIASGYAHVHGMIYWNDANVDMTPTTPTTGTTRKRIVVRKLWDDPVSGSVSVKLAMIQGTDGSTSLPALTQTDGVRWEIPVCNFTVTTGGTISGLVSDREFLLPPGVIAVGSVTSTGSVSGRGIVSGTINNGTDRFDIVLSQSASFVTVGVEGNLRTGATFFPIFISGVSGLGTTTISIALSKIQGTTVGAWVASTDLESFTIYLTAYR